MKRDSRSIFNLLFVLAVVGLVACGGSKETVEFPPDPFPEPETTAQQPVADSVVTEPEPRATFEEEPARDPLVLQTINYEFDKSALTPTARAILAENARLLQQYPDTNIRIEGHCDERGTVEYNLALGERRARSAKDYLVNFGISPSRITIISYGKERPIDPRHTPEAWAKNRRAEFVILN